MISKENSDPPREKVAGAPTAVERAGEGVKAAAAAASSAVASVTDAAPASGAASASVAPAAYVPTRRRSRRNLLL